MPKPNTITGPMHVIYVLRLTQFDLCTSRGLAKGVVSDRHDKAVAGVNASISRDDEVDTTSGFGQVAFPPKACFAPDHQLSDLQDYS